MIREKSCGAVVWTDKKELKILLIKHKNGGHWSFPKGHVEKDETEQETAIREIFEETGLTVELDTKFRSVVTYSPKENVIKDVIFFSAKSLSEVVTAQEAEVTDIAWFTPCEAEKIISFDTDKNILKEFLDYRG